MRKKAALIIRLALIAGLAAWAVVNHRRRAAREGRLSGTLEYTEYQVGARTAGRLIEAPFKESDPVARGQLLARLDRFTQAEKDAARAERLRARGGLSEQALEQARLALEDQQVLSPVDGIVLVKVRQAGEVVPAGGPVAVIGETADAWVKVYVSEDKLATIRMGQGARLRFDGVGKTLPGRVSAISPKAEFTPRNAQTPEERATQTFGVKIYLETADPSLKPGLFADVDWE